MARSFSSSPYANRTIENHSINNSRKHSVNGDYDGNEEEEDDFEEEGVGSVPDIRVKESEIDVNTQFTQNVTRKIKKRKIAVMTQNPNRSGYLDGVADDKPAQAGIILKLELFNFMCHDAFKLDFGEQTNFIIGRNGSGKSAVLTGISVALGAKASETDRGNSLKGLIMHGKNVARAIVTFKNEGPEAYKSKEYGNKITIERVLRKEGAATCNIKDEWGKIVSNKKQTIEEILDYYGITIANPMTILTQTEAKTFLAHSTDEGKFKYFMEGTRLQETYNNVSELQRDVKEINHKINKDTEILTQAKARYDEAMAVWANFRHSDEFRKKQELLSGKRLWLEVRDKEDQLLRAQKILKERQDEIYSSENTIGELESNIQSLSHEEIELGGSLQEIKRNYDTAESNKIASKQHAKEISDNLTSITRRTESLENEVRNELQLLKETEAKIKKETERLKSSTDDSFQSLQATKAKKLEEYEQKKAEADNYVQQLAVSKQSREEIEKKYKGILGALKKEIHALEREKENSKNKEVNKMDTYGSAVASLVRDTNNNAKHYQGKVVGPVGLHVSLKSEFAKWGWVLEAILQRSLSTFIVENYKDASLLRSRMKKFNIFKDILVRKSEVFDYNNSIPPGDHLKVADLLSIDDPSIQCWLVDSNKIHSTLLIEDRKKAEQALMEDQSGLINAVICMVSNGAVRIVKRNGKLQTDPVSRPSYNSVRLNVTGDSENPTARIQREIDSKKEEYERMVVEYNVSDRGLKKEFAELAKLNEGSKNRANMLRKAIFKMDEKLTDFEALGGKLDSYKEDKINIETQMQIKVEQIKALHVEIDKKKELGIAQMAKFREDSEALKEISINKEQLERKMEELRAKKEDMKDDISLMFTKIDKLKNDVAKLEEFTTNGLPPVILQLTTNADSHCPRETANIKPDDSVDAVNKEIETIAERLEALEQEVGVSREQAKFNVIQARDNYNGVKEKHDSSAILHNQLLSSLNARIENLTSTASLLILEVNSVFEQSLKIRRFTGKIDFDFHNSKLTLKVSTKKNEKLRNVESFSGGEKSFAQIAFLLAIWKPMQSKVRGLDEFDVFMDQINRRLALKLILEKVSANPKTQTIFITPLQITQIEGLDSKSVHIHEINPPERSNNSEQ